ncbi:MAG: hypothetical protein WEC84_02120 [Candidatus Andersenbacteria bacterium]
MLQLISFNQTAEGLSISETLVALTPSLLVLGWLLVFALIMWIAWATYKVLKMIDYVSSIEWTFFQVTVPPESEETPKSMEVLYEILGGVHKSPDLVEQYFDGYLEAWYSCEIQFTEGRARYIIVVPTAHRQFFEGAIYGQYPKANIREVEDYTLRYDWHDIRKKFEIWGSEVDMPMDEIMPIKTYKEFESTFAEEDTYVDPHAGMIDALTTVSPGEEFWFQLLIRPESGKDMSAFSERAQKEVAKIAGQAPEEPDTIFDRFKKIATALPKELLDAATKGPLETEEKKREQQLRFFNPVDEAKMKGILLKASQSVFKAKMRIIHIAPIGQMRKPNVGRAFGVFKQFNTYHLNGLRPEPTTKANGPNYLMRDTRRYWREKRILLNFQWRDFWGRGSGQWFSSEELATLYHFPVKYLRSPGVERAKAGLTSPPDNLPYA